MRRGNAFYALLLISAFCPPPASAGPALLFELADSKVLYSEDADNHWHPASLAKLMTAYLTFEEIKSGRLGLKSKIACSAAAHDEPPSKLGLPIGGELTVDLALQALIIKSANDVAVMLAEAVAGSESAFIDRMNATARKLGMDQTNFVNANGLPAPEQITTARDLAKLARALLTDFPEHARYWSMPHMKLGKNRLRSHNSLLQMVEGADGLKTGFTCDSGFNIVASATRDGRQLVAVVLGDKSSNERNVRAASLLEYGFHQGWAQLFNSKTLDNMPFAPTETGVKSVRADVDAMSCNSRGPAKVRKHRSRRRKPTQAEAPEAGTTLKAEQGDGEASELWSALTEPAP